MACVAAQSAATPDAHSDLILLNKENSFSDQSGQGLAPPSPTKLRGMKLINVYSGELESHFTGWHSRMRTPAICRFRNS